MSKMGGTGEVLGSCVFDVLAILGVVCLKLPREGLRLPLPLMVYFLLWILTSTAINLLLFYTNDASTWPIAALMILLYVFFVAGIFLLNRCVDLSEHGAEHHAVAPALPAPKEDSPLIAGAADRGDGGGGDVCGELCCSRACAFMKSRSSAFFDAFAASCTCSAALNSCCSDVMAALSAAICSRCALF